MNSHSSGPADQSHGDQSSESDAIDEAHFRAELEELGLTQLVFDDDGSAPPVDRDLLSKLAARQLPERISRLVYRLVYSYRDWNEAFTQAMVEYNRQLRASEQAPASDEQDAST